MLDRHSRQMDECAALAGVQLADDPFVFSLELDCSKPMPPAYVTRQLAKVKDILGIPDKRPETIVLEDKALRLFRSGTVDRRPGKPGPMSEGAMSYPEIGRRLGRSQKWAFNAVASALRREAAPVLSPRPEALLRQIEHPTGGAPPVLETAGPPRQRCGMSNGTS
jgi:hypothetical protein